MPFSVIVNKASSSSTLVSAGAHLVLQRLLDHQFTKRGGIYA